MPDAVLAGRLPGCRRGADEGIPERVAGRACEANLGATSLLYAAVLTAGAVTVDGGLSTADWILLGLLVAVLVADGIVNVLPAGFRTFKDRTQAAWVEQHRGTGREGDRHLFGTVNALLAVASAAALMIVIGYRPIDPWAVAVGAAVALALLALMVGGPLRRTR
jgi:hypothetical protein